MAQDLLALRVPKERTEEVRRLLLDRGLLDTRRKFLKESGYVEIPLRSADESLRSLGNVVTQEMPAWKPRQPTPFELILKEVDLPADLKTLLPRKWEKVGDILLLRLPEELRPHVEEVCGAYARVLRVKTVLEASGGIHGTVREPRAEVLWGDGTETVHKENGILYKLDLSKVMFSSGNVDERVRMARVCKPGEVVVDMFAGIGYFSLPMAVHGRAARVYACEVSPVAYEYLQENIRLNRAEAVVPLLGDCRDVAPEGVADRVILGYLQDTHLYLPKAVRALRDGGWVHYHEACPDAVSDRPLEHLKEVAQAEGLKIRRLHRHRVKRYAPGVSHWVLDVFIS
jgi:tRNA wybutosine-synthesizing protein 2